MNSKKGDLNLNKLLSIFWPAGKKFYSSSINFIKVGSGRLDGL